MMNRGTELAYAMRDVTAQFMVHFADRPAVQTWLAGEGIAAAAVHPAFSGSGLYHRPHPRFYWCQSRHLVVYRRCARDGLRGNRLAQASAPFEVIAADQVRLAFFPWLEAIDRAEVARRSAALGRRACYPQQDAGDRGSLSAGIPWRHKNRDSRRRDSVRCRLRRRGCFGFAWGSRESAFNATSRYVGGGKPLEASATRRGGYTCRRLFCRSRSWRRPSRRPARNSASAFMTGSCGADRDHCPAFAHKLLANRKPDRIDSMMKPARYLVTLLAAAILVGCASSHPPLPTVQTVELVGTTAPGTKSPGYPTGFSRCACQIPRRTIARMAKMCRW